MTTTTTDSIEQTIIDIAKRARLASLELSQLSPDKKNEILNELAKVIDENRKELISENEKDILKAPDYNLSEAMIDRLRFDNARIDGMIQGIQQVICLPDPVGSVLETTTRPNGIVINKTQVPIGVIGIIFESRPNVTVDCAILCLKSGNASILRGGKEAFYSNTFLASLIQQAIQKSGANPDMVQLIPTTDREALNVMLKQDDYIHAIIPRGGEGLIRFVSQNSHIPVIKHYKGVCSVYVDKEADIEMAKQIIINAKCQRPGVCNAIENVFIHQDVIRDALPVIANELVKNKVEIRCDEVAKTILDEKNIGSSIATEEDFFEEYLDLILSIKTVTSVDDAISCINKYGSGHSDSIITRNEKTAKHFQFGVDTATAYWNASTRFTDGFEFGLGAEIGISTDRLHARGPMGLKELCTYKYIINGTGQIRG
jgi:glutamate-5-semialdehyde dehydrogenase